MKREGNGRSEGERREGSAVTRLREQREDAVDDGTAWAIDLLREAPPHRPRAGERQRVLLGLGRPARASARHAWTVRFAVVVALVVAATTIARAGLGRLPRWLAAYTASHAPAPESHVRSAPAAWGRSRQHAAAAPVSAPAAPPVEAVAENALSPAAPPPVATDAPRPSHRRPAPPPAAAPPDDDSALVMQAMRALRRDGDPALARTLSRTYLERHPRGKLAEEALALAIEAALAHGDADAPALAEQYLRQYPSGPFRGLARQASRASAGAAR
jgi:hypothetical protein